MEDQPEVQPQEREILITMEAGRRLSISDQTVRKLVREGDMRAVRIGRVVRIPAVDLEMYVERLLADAGQEVEL